MAAECDPGCLGGPFRAVCSWSTRDGRGTAVQSAAVVGPESELLLDRLAGFPGADEVVVHRWSAAVLAGKGRDNVDMSMPSLEKAVPDGHPPDPGRVIVRDQAHAVHALGRDLVPLCVRQERILGGGREDAVPDGVLAAEAPRGAEGNVEEADQVPEVTLAAWLRPGARCHRETATRQRCGGHGDRRTFRGRTGSG
jgi:hypothetical protein